MTFLANHIRNLSFFLYCLMKMILIFRDMTCIVSARMSFFWFWLLTFLCLEKLISSRDEHFCLINILNDIILVFTIHLLKYKWHFNWWIFWCSAQREQFSSWSCWQKKKSIMKYWNQKSWWKIWWIVHKIMNWKEMKNMMNCTWNNELRKEIRLNKDYYKSRKYHEY